MHYGQPQQHRCICDFAGTCLKLSGTVLEEGAAPGGAGETDLHVAPQDGVLSPLCFQSWGMLRGSSLT